MHTERPGRKRLSWERGKQRFRKPSVIFFVFLILLISLSMMILAGESTIRIAGNELRQRALETCKAEIGYISDALYSQLTAIQLQNTEILNNESVLALTMRSSILNKYELTTYESTIMKLIRSRMSQINLDTFSELYIPTIHTILTPQKAAEATEEELSEIRRIVTDFPGGLYYTEEYMGFWSASPLIHNPSSTLQSRIMLTSIRRKSLESLLQHYSSQPDGAQLLLILGKHEIASSHEMKWDENLFDQPDGEVRTVSRDGSPYVLIQTGHAFSDLSIVAILPLENVMKNMVHLQQRLKTLELIGILIIIIATVAFWQIVCRPLKNISVKMQAIGEGDLSVRMAPQKTAELEDVGKTFNSMAKRLQTLIDREYRSRLLAVSAEKKALQYQITPHFLYNIYFQLRSLILLNENEQAGKLADLMGRYLRYTVHQGEDCAALEEEMEHARNYADIQCMRFNGRIEVRYDIAASDWGKVVVPRLILQPLLENAFGHGLKNVDSGGLILFSLYQNEMGWTISVEDNGETLTEEMLDMLRCSVTEGDAEAGDSVALLNIHRRLQLHFGLRSGLTFARSGLGGLKVSLRIFPEERKFGDGTDSAGG